MANQLPEPEMRSKRSFPRTNDYHHGDLRNALIAAGRRALQDISPQDLSLRYLAKVVGVSEAAPSRHFAGMDALLAAIAAGGFRELAALRADIQSSGDDVMSTAYRMMRVYVEFAMHHKGLFGLMIGPRIVSRTAHPELSEEASRSFQLFAGAIEALAIENGWKPNQLNLVAHAAWSMEHGLATLTISNRVPRADRPVSVEPMIDFAIAAFLGAVTAGPAHLNKVLTRLPKSVKQTEPETKPELALRSPGKRMISSTKVSPKRRRS
ncbi:TetR/AcrR family transcriptional regulator [Bradyrhizobium australafricanum]|uniref:TetR/AcrR family transcriptional regulator n=1 Tax=Bradyrhizobium australafricanum TaxID=2821406 RepID=UPI001CE39669|nr:TetR-like C-terminal domain-containing protein [Bradyrhizobium australafricanum]MCA6100501.1 WHG domain-containing protein [Bradyrhizobium australafricanum]